MRVVYFIFKTKLFLHKTYELLTYIYDVYNINFELDNSILFYLFLFIFSYNEVNTIVHN